MLSNRNVLFRKRLLILPALLFLVALLFSEAIPSSGAEPDSPVQVLVNGREVFFPDARPFVDEKGRVQAPARFVAQELGAQVTWDGEAATAHISGHGKTIALAAGQDAATVNGEVVSLDSGAVLLEGRIHVPVRFIAETLGAAVQWDESARTVRVTMELLSTSDSIGFGDLSLSGYNHDLQFAPDRERAVFSGYSYQGDDSEGKNSKLLLLDINKESITVLDEGDYLRAFGWDAGGENVLYMKDGSLYRMSLKDSKKSLIAEESYYGSFSPDGRRIAYVQRKNGLWICDAEGGNKKRLTDTTDDWYPIWYPDGRHLFYFNDLGKELSDGAGHLEGMAKISVADGSVEGLLPQKNGKFRRAEWIVPGRSLHVVSGWDDGYYQHIVDLVEGKITDLGENLGHMNYATAVDTAVGRLLKASADGMIQIYDATGNIQKSFDPDLDAQSFFSAAFTPDGRSVLTMSGTRSGGEGPEKREIAVLDTESGSYRSVADGGENYEACFWGSDDSQILILEKTVVGSSYKLTGFTKMTINNMEGPKEGERNVFVPVQESTLSGEEKAFIEEVKRTKGIHRKGALCVIALGAQPNPGYGLEIVKTEMSWEQAKVYVKLTRPEPGKMYATVISYPYLVGRVNLPKYTTISFLNVETGEPLQ